MSVSVCVRRDETKMKRDKLRQGVDGRLKVGDWRVDRIKG